MKIDVSRLENVTSKLNKTIARCPACAELSQDKKGNHLIINEDGRFACVMYQGEDGREHRKRIFRLVGIKEPYDVPINKIISVKQVSQASQERSDIKMDDVLGRIGRHFQSYSKNSVNLKFDKIDEIVRIYEDISSEPDHGTRRHKEKIFSEKWKYLEKVERQQLVDRLLAKGLLSDRVRQALEIFNGKVVSFF